MSPRSRHEVAIPEAAPIARVGAKRRLRVRLRWASVAFATLLPGIAIALGDYHARSDQLRVMDRHEVATYLLWSMVSAGFWGALVYVAIQRKTKLRWLALALLLGGAIFAVGGQAYTFERYRAYINHRAVLVGTSFLPSIRQQLWFDRWPFAKTILPPMFVALALALVGSRFSRFKRSNVLFAVDIGVIALLAALYGNVGEQGAPPDVLYLSAMGQLSRAHWDHNDTVERVHPGPRSPLALPALTAKPKIQRNVLYVITESVRAMSTCVGYDPDCKYTPFSNEEAKGRLPLRQMRAVDSTTAISLAIMWTGLLPTADRKALHEAPLLWEYAHAAGLETTYWTSQNLLFGNSGTWLAGTPIDRQVSATQIDTEATMEIGASDGKLVDYALGDMGGLKEPYLAVVHLSNTHFPYAVDPDHAPFQPEELNAGPGYETVLRNHYQDAIYLQDMAIGRLIHEVRRRPESARTVIVFVSDHGEQLREHGGAGHTFTLYDEEIRIPFWIDAPQGTLTDDEEKNLRSLENATVTNLDVMPTLLDLMGLLDEPEIQAFRDKMPGHSLLRGGTPDLRLTMTNCTELWACAFKNWGAMQGHKKLISHQGDFAWRCFDTSLDPGEEHDLGLAACGDLLPLAEDGRGKPF